MKKSIFFLIAFMLFLNPSGAIPRTDIIDAFALEWPSDVSVSAEGAILMDADSGAVLYGKNIHETYFPASITKILTALVIVENCDLNEELTFSYSSIHDVEENSSNAGFAVGDTITVRDALYALLLKSANEAANALAEHCSGSVEEFAKLMNEKAKSLGCKNSNFRNPSGLNDENHYVTAYDYALISQAAFDNPLFVEIDSTTFYHLPKTKNYPEGQTIYTHHAMLKRSNQLYYPGIFGGKTGYTTLAGNTLVTGAQRDGLRLITVVLNSKKTHYQDTKALLDFGFSEFENVDIAELDPDFFSVMEDIHLIQDNSPAIRMESGRSVTLPKEVDVTDVGRIIRYDLEEQEFSDVVAKVSYSIEDRVIGSTYLLSNLSAEKEHIASDAKNGETVSAGSQESNLNNAVVDPGDFPETFAGESQIFGDESMEEIAVSSQIASEEATAVMTDASQITNEEMTTKGGTEGTSGSAWAGMVEKIEKYLYFIYVLATFLIMALLILLLKLILFIKDRIAIRRSRRRRSAKRRANMEKRDE